MAMPGGLRVVILGIGRLSLCGEGRDGDGKPRAERPLPALMPVTEIHSCDWRRQRRAAGRSRLQRSLHTVGTLVLGQMIPESRR